MKLRTCLTTLLFFTTFSLTHIKATPNTLQYRLIQLDKCLNDKKEYDKVKENEIAKCREKLGKARSGDQRYGACIKLYDEYKSYQYDSAYAYANRSLILAKRLRNINYQVESECAMTFCLLSAGLYKEAFDKLGGGRRGKGFAGIQENLLFHGGAA